MSVVPGYDPHLSLNSSHLVVGIIGTKVLVKECQNQVVHAYGDLKLASLSVKSYMHLGDWCGKPCFAVVFEQGHEFAPHDVFSCSSLRRLLGVVAEDAFFLAGRALQLAHWLEFHRHCGRCGEATTMLSGERALCCSVCEAVFFPRIAPCVIGIVIRDKQCLLAHNAQFPESLYSVLAGFIEPGETAEQALEREIKEEVGIEVSDVSYVASQSWPFPSQLMLGFTARHRAGEICVDGKEIIHADWFGVNNLPQRPPPQTLSGQLIQAFVDEVNSRG